MLAVLSGNCFEKNSNLSCVYFSPNLMRWASTLLKGNFNWKIIIVSTLAATIISVFSGVLGGVDFGSILLRAFVVAIIFTVFTALLNFVVTKYLVGEDDDLNVKLPNVEKGAADGSKVNIVLTEDDNVVLEASADSEEEVADGEIVAKELPEGKEEIKKAGDSSNVNQSFDTTLEIDTLPDLDTFSTAFTSKEENIEEVNESETKSGYNSSSTSFGSKLSGEGLAGAMVEQNSPEDLAKAVKTVLKREETG